MNGSIVDRCGLYLVLFFGAPVAASQVVVDFDVDPAGNPIVAPSGFQEATRLDDLYAPLGVTFAGPGPQDGGAILNEYRSGFDVKPRSGSNFFAFSVTASYSDGGIPRPPEMIMFETPVTSVSIFAGDGNVHTFTMEAFDSAGQSLALDTRSNVGGEYVELSVSGSDIRSVVIDRPNGADDGFVFDDLTYTPVPEPTRDAASCWLPSSVRLLDGLV